MAGTKTWADGDVVTAADLNGFVRDQWITICTAGTRPTTTQVGRTIFETDTSRYYRWDGAAWQMVANLGAWDTWTPAPTQSVALTFTNNGCRVLKIGRLVVATAEIQITSAGTAAARMLIPLPYAAPAAGFLSIVGSFMYYKGGTFYQGGVSSNGQLLAGGTQTELFGTSPAVTAANLDTLTVNLSYLSAT